MYDVAQTTFFEKTVRIFSPGQHSGQMLKANFADLAPPETFKRSLQVICRHLDEGCNRF